MVRNFPHALAYLLALATVLAAPACGDDDDDGPSLDGDWVIEEFEANGQDVGIAGNGEFEFDEDDGEFEVTLRGQQVVRIGGEYELDGDELELEYEVNDNFFVGIVGLLLNQDIPDEEYEVTFDGDDEVEFEGEINGVEVEMTLERD